LIVIGDHTADGKRHETSLCMGRRPDPGRQLSCRC
jgi:hypothetical protein